MIDILVLFQQVLLLVLCVIPGVVLKKTKLMDVLANLMSWAGVALALAVVAFFMIFPTCVFILKLFALFM